ncbi:MAG: sigma-70 family RNA polymerase sigma factor [Bacteroidales bacterium]|nr:sigma-70 family RNA polymerase sigma factor [Bacteroidales bacterium]
MTTTQFNHELVGLKGKLLCYAMRLTADRECANDLVQETFLKALSFRERYAQDGSFKAWMYTIMKNTFINDYRRNMRSCSRLNGANNEFHVRFSTSMLYPSPDAFFSSQEIMNDIYSLDDDYKVPFTMFIDGYKYKEIADKLALPLGTVKSRIFFTRKKLVRKLAHEC